MNPQQTPRSNPTLVRDITPPAAISAEIVNDIPVRNPLGSNPGNAQPLKSPAAKVFKPSAAAAPNAADKELDYILRDVNSSVKQSENSAEAKFEHLSGVRKKVAVKKARIDQAHRGSPPIAATIVASLVALLMTVAAFLVYQKGY